jgi:hypothetical protein
VLTALVSLVLAVSSPATLTITVWPQGPKGPSHTSTLKCEPTGGTLVGRVKACARLAAMNRDPFAPAPSAVFCTQIYGGPETALVRGTFRGRREYAQFSQKDGCAIARWNRVAFLFAK